MAHRHKQFDTVPEAGGWWWEKQMKQIQKYKLQSENKPWEYMYSMMIIINKQAM